MLLQNEQEIENTNSIFSIISTCPTALDKDNPDIIKAGNYYLPFSTGFEIECHKRSTYNEENFKNIPNIIDVINDSNEQRYRIPSGIIGLQCLQEISVQLKLNSVLTDSGIHYHVDCTDNSNILEYFVLDNYNDLIIHELEKWDYKGSYNEKNKSSQRGSWYRIQPTFKTIEFRIGEMTFDYPLLFKRIHHLNKLVEFIIRFENAKNNPILLYDKKKNIKKVLNNRTKFIDF